MVQGSEQAVKARSIVPLLLAFIVGAVILATLSLLTLNVLGVVLGVGLGLSALIACQYLLWGWWLGNAIRRDETRADEFTDSGV